MAKQLAEVDAVIVGMGWSGGIIAKELAQAGLTVVGLERGGPRSTEEEFAIPHIRDELQYGVRLNLMQDVRRDTLTVRNQISQEALPMRRISSFQPGDGVGGSGVHWNGLSWRWGDMEFKIRSMYEERYGKKFIPADMSLQDWGVSYAELEPYFERFEATAGVSGQAGVVGGKIMADGNPFEAPRRAPYPLPPLHRTLSGDLFAQASRQLGYHPFNVPAANASQAFVNRDGIAMGQCQYCGFCDKFGCEANAKGSPHNTVIPVALKQSSFSLRTHARVTRIETDRGGKHARGVTYINMLTGEETFQPARIVVLAAYALNNTHLMLTSGIGKAYDPVSQTGLVGKNYCYNTGARTQLFFEDKTFNPFMGAGGTSVAIDDFYSNWDFDRSAHNYIGGFVPLAGSSGGRPIEYHPVPPGTPRWGPQWKEAMAKWYQRSMSIGALASVMPNRYNYFDLDPTYKDATGAPMLRLTFDFKENEHRISTHAAQLIDRLGKSLNPVHITPPAPKVTPYSVVGYQGTHNTGGTIMGSHPGESVVNKFGQSWQVPNLFIAGGSIFPHNSAYNPTSTIGALSFFAADAITQRYVKRPGQLL
jgi:gluconate 2-dehydrogenase alpha chain